MTNEEFIRIAKEQAAKYSNGVNSEKITADDVYVVWFCKTLHHRKALLSTPVSDGMYYEATHNGINNEIYFDAYRKAVNICIPAAKYGAGYAHGEVFRSAT